MLNLNKERLNRLNEFDKCEAENLVASYNQKLQQNGTVDSWLTEQVENLKYCRPGLVEDTEDLFESYECHVYIESKKRWHFVGWSTVQQKFVTEFYIKTTKAGKFAYITYTYLNGTVEKYRYLIEYTEA